MAKSAPSNGSGYWEQTPRATKAGECNPCIPSLRRPKRSPPQGLHRPCNRERWIRPMRPNTCMTPGDNLYGQVGSRPRTVYYALDGYCTWLWRRLRDSSPCPLRVLQGSPDRHSTTNPKQLATKQLATTAAHAATISYNHTHTQDSTATAARRTNQTRGIQQSTGSMAKETSRQRRRRPNPIAIFSNMRDVNDALRAI